MSHLSERDTLRLLETLRSLARAYEPQTDDAADISAAIERPALRVTNARVYAFKIGQEAGRHVVDHPASALRGLISGLKSAAHARLQAVEVHDG